jgi:lipopolysaccharide export system protein LptC
MAAPPARPNDRPSASRVIRAGWERVSVYLPVILMGVIALGTYWLARNSPIAGPAQTQARPTHDPDAIMRRFSVRSFAANGRLKSELHGTEARHYPDTDTVEVDQPRMRMIGEHGEVTLASARQALSNGDGSEVELIGDAVVTREPVTEPSGRAVPRMEFRGQFLHVYVNTERVTSNKPVELLRGDDRLSGDNLVFDNVTQVLEMNGRVKGLLMPRPAPQP